MILKRERLRPNGRRGDIRNTLGSARSGRLNYRTIYTAWLVSAVLYHVPALSAIGIDARTDLSMLLTSMSLPISAPPLASRLLVPPRHSNVLHRLCAAFFATLCLGALLQGIHHGLALAGAYPKEYAALPRGASWTSVATSAIVNSATVAVMCSRCVAAFPSERANDHH